MIHQTISNFIMLSVVPLATELVGTATITALEGPINTDSTITLGVVIAIAGFLWRIASVMSRKFNLRCKRRNIKLIGYDRKY